MQISLSKLNAVVTGIIIIGLIGYTGYFLFGIFVRGPKPNPTPVISEASVGVYGSKMQKAASALVNPAQKVNLSKKDLSFTEKDLFNSFTELPIKVPLTDSRGREDPFVPYVAP